jgi:hypothetical protein
MFTEGETEGETVDAATLRGDPGIADSIGGAHRHPQVSAREARSGAAPTS